MWNFNMTSFRAITTFESLKSSICLGLASENNHNSVENSVGLIRKSQYFSVSNSSHGCEKICKREKEICS
jgi:hypothetical protein